MDSQERQADVSPKDQPLKEDALASLHDQGGLCYLWLRPDDPVAEHSRHSQYRPGHWQPAPLNVRQKGGDSRPKTSNDPAARVSLPTIEHHDFEDCGFPSGEHTTLNPRVSGAPQLSKALGELLKSRDEKTDLVFDSKPEHAENAELTFFSGLPRTFVASERSQAKTDRLHPKSPDFLLPFVRVNSPASQEEFSFAEFVEHHQLHPTRGINETKESSARNLQNPSTVTCGDNASATTKHTHNSNQRKVTHHFAVSPPLLAFVWLPPRHLQRPVLLAGPGAVFNEKPLVVSGNGSQPSSRGRVQSLGINLASRDKHTSQPHIHTTHRHIANKLRQQSKMESRESRFLDPSSAMAAITRHKAEAIKLAREQGTAVKEMCRRAKTDVPPYEFEELIGKGAYGRVYKGRQMPSGRLVAIKVLDIDSLDYKSLRDFRDESIKDFIHETKVMKQVKDSGAKNINELIEAISIHSQLWLVCEYCPGGSVRTLMRATGDKLEERFIIPIARELAVGLRAIHDAGIIHRDVKAANILVHEEGRLEICDFGVAGILQSQRDKRSTWIGTPHWMPPEMFATRGAVHEYGSEIDVWAYGCTLYEFATGNPPNAGLRERMQIGRQLNRSVPKLDSDQYSQGLKDLIAFALNSDPATRPSMKDILEHPYIAGTEEDYPTSSVSELVRNYYQWSQRGGQRISLFHPGGAAAAEIPGTEKSDDDWNFSTTDGFERRFSVIDLDQIAASLAEMEDSISPNTPTAEHVPGDDVPETDMDPEQKANFDERVRRGAEAMEGLFNEEKPSYKYETKSDFVPVQPNTPSSDLPLRTEIDRSSVMSTLIDIDIGSFDSSHYAAGAPSAQPFQLADADTIRANRSSLRLNRNSNENNSQPVSSDVEGGELQDETLQPPSGPRPPTMDWKFPTFMQAQEGETEAAKETTPAQPKQEDTSQAEKRATMEWTFPVMSAENTSPANDSTVPDRHDTIRAPVQDLKEEQYESGYESRPSTSASNKSTLSESDYDPFRFDRPQTPPNPPNLANMTEAELREVIALVDEAFGDPEAHGPGLFDGPDGPDGPGPVEWDHPLWRDNQYVFDPDNIPPLNYDIPDRPASPSEPESPFPEPLQALPSEEPSTAEEADPGAILFPELVPPSAESLMEGAEEDVVMAELDRILGDFLGALRATEQVLARTEPQPQTRGNRRERRNRRR